MVKPILHSLLLQKISKVFSKLVSVHKIFVMVITISLLCFSTIVKADVTASVDKQSLDLGDNIQLTIYAGNISNNAVPDLSTVVNDFDLLSSSQTQQVAMSNNRMVTETVWIFTLSPKHAGILTIPAISLGSQQTSPITIRVNDGTGGISNAPVTASATPTVAASAPPPVTPSTATPSIPDVFLKADLSPSSPYVQSQAIYTLRLYYDKQIANPQISEPSADGANFIRIGQNDVYQKVINNHPYQVIEMKYAFFPEKSGTVNIKGPTFMGNMLVGSMVSFTNANFKSVQTSANSIKATIQPIPTAAANTWWLPAGDVQISEQWSSNLDNVQVGVPVTRTVKLAAQGIMATQLPVMIANNIPGFQIYPDKPAMTSSSDGENVFGTRIEKAAYIPTQAGTVTLPSIVVNWWDTKTDMMETATLPAKTINVLPAASGSSQPITPVSIPSNTESNTLMTNLTTQKNSVISKMKATNYWFWITVALGIIWLITIIAWLIYRGTRVKKTVAQLNEKSHDIGTSETLRQARARVEQAVKAQNPQQFAVALIGLAQRVWPEASILSLTDIASKCKSAQAKEAIAALDKIRYSASSGTWQADFTWQMIANDLVPEKSISKKNDGQLPKLYPE
jgi:hypothetical protein